MAQVKIGAEFFKKAKRDYYNWTAAWLREIFQNAVDSGANEISFNFIKNPETNRLMAIVEDNGCGMNEDTLVNKLLALGASGKNFNGTVGGFGKAKELLFFAQNSYKIETNDIVLSGIGGEYEISRSIPTISSFINGTRISVDLDTNNNETMQHFHEKTMELVRRSAFHGNVKIQDEIYHCRSFALDVLREFPTGKFHETNSTMDHGIVVRVNGNPMYFRSIYSMDKCLAYELDEKHHQSMTSNRDGLTGDAYTEFESFVSELTIDKKAALLKASKNIKLFIGNKDIENRQKQRIERVAASTVELRGWSLTASRDVLAIVDEKEEAEVEGIKLGELPKKVEDKELELKYGLTEETYLQYINVTTTVPERWLVTSESKNVKWVLSAWKTAVRELFVLEERKPAFIVGFVFDEYAQATYTKTLKAFCIQPCTSDFKMKYVKTKESCAKMLVLAAHEFIHFKGREWHDEDFASSFTQFMQLVMINASDIIQKMMKS